MTLDITMQRLLTDTRDRSGSRDPVECGVAGDVAFPDLCRQVEMETVASETGTAEAELGINNAFDPH